MGWGKFHVCLPKKKCYLASRNYGQYRNEKATRQNVAFSKDLNLSHTFCAVFDRTVAERNFTLAQTAGEHNKYTRLLVFLQML
jgi:hypothetical protein